MPSEWTHETLKHYIERVLTERDIRYTEMFQARDTAIKAALLERKEASDKAETALKEYKLLANEFRGTLSDQAETLLLRSEAETRFSQHRELIDAQSKQIIELQKSNSSEEGGAKASATSKSQSRWAIALIVMIGTTVAGAIGSLIFYLATK